MIGAAVGTVIATRGGLVEAMMPASPIGAGMRITRRDGRTIAAQLTAVDGARVILAPLGELDGVAAGDRVTEDPDALAVCLGTAALGRAFDAQGVPLDGGEPLVGKRGGRARASSLPGQRVPLAHPFHTGVRAIDGPLALATGARIGIFGAPGCGKSTLLETIVASADADATVVGLVGERGREAQRWLAAIDARTTIVCATSDRSAAERVRAAEIAFAQAEALSERGLDVLLVLDSLARVAGAARDVAVAANEPVGRAGYPASVFSVLARLLERAGRFAVGSITLVATVLSDGADERDPVSEACRAALDGHIVLTERLAQQGWFPAIDLPASASRTIGDVATPEHRAAARTLRRAVALLDQTREARGLGLDPAAGDPFLRRALSCEGAIAAYLQQTERSDHARTLTELIRLTDMLDDGYLR